MSPMLPWMIAAGSPFAYLAIVSIEGSVVADNSRLFASEFYSWDSFTNLDKIINYNQYYWLPNGPDQVVVATETVYNEQQYIVQDYQNGYNIYPENSNIAETNPTLTLLRGGTYTFTVDQNSQFWIQGEPGVTGYSSTRPNMSVRDIYGVSNNGATHGVVTFSVPSKDAQNDYLFSGSNPIGVVSTRPFSEINGARVSQLVGGIDGVTSLEGLTVMFYNTGVPSELGYVSNFFDYTSWDTNNNLVAAQTISIQIGRAHV